LDELDVRIFRLLVTDNSGSVISSRLGPSFRDSARLLQVDEVTVRNRYRRFREKGFLSSLVVTPNPNLFGYGMTKLVVDTPSRSPKQDMIRKLRLVHGVTTILDHYGDSFSVIVLFESEESLSRTVELISRITNAENVTRFRLVFPTVHIDHLTDTDWAIMRSMGKDALKSHVQIAKELGITARTVKNRLQRLEAGHAFVILAAVDLASIDGMIGLILLYSYANHGVKGAVDEAIIARFEGNCLFAGLDDPERAYLTLVAPTMASVKPFLEWAKQQPGVATARIEIVVESIRLSERVIELFQPNKLAGRGPFQHPTT
jgi:DNA-binding Lrp family transcriptional regulator